MKPEKSLEYIGYMTEEMKEFLGDKLIKEQREGLGVVGNFVKTCSGATHLLSKGDIVNKYAIGCVSISSLNRSNDERI